MKKRLIGLLLALCLLAGFMPVMACQSDASTYSGTCGENVSWTLDTDTGVLSISGTGAMDNFGTWEAPWYSCGTTKKIIIVDGVTSIGDYAFGECKSLTSIRIPDSVTNIGNYAFMYCESLMSVTVPNSVVSIGNYAFAYCESLTDVVIGSGVTRIGEDAFNGCSSLVSVSIPRNVTSIGKGAFSNCDNMTDIWVDAENKFFYSDIYGVLYNKEQSTLIRCPCGYNGNYTMPDSVNRIDDYAFSDCKSLSSITIPNGITNIGEYAFGGCINLTSILIPDGLTGIGDLAFAGCTALTSIAIPAGVNSIGYGTFSGCTSLKYIQIPDSVASIGDFAFSDCTNLTTIKIPNGVTNIGVRVFAFCKNLMSITIPNSVMCIDREAFWNCNNLTSIAIPSAVTNIGDCAFFGCTNLTNITIPKDVTSLGHSTFQFCTSLRHIHFLGDMPLTVNSAFSNCASDLMICYLEGTEGWESCQYSTEPWNHIRTGTCENITYTCNTCGEEYTCAISHSYVDGECTNCGAVEITQPILDASLTFGAQLYLENDLTMAFRVKQDKLTAYDISTAYLVVERDVYASGAKEAAVEAMTIRDYKIEGGRLIFSYPGIAAAQMNDAIRVTLYIQDANGQQYVSPVLNTSVATYLDGLLTASASDAKLVTLIMDMVNYGTAAQIYFDRHADAPVNEAYESFKTYASYASADFTKVLENLATTENAEGKSGKLNLSLDLGTRIGIQYKVTVPTGVNVEDVTLVVTDANGNVLETLRVAGNATDSRGRYLVNFYGSTSRDMRRVVYATAYAKGEAITGTYAYSISSYAWGVQENAETQPADLVNVTRAMLLYGDSAAAYFS